MTKYIVTVDENGNRPWCTHWRNERYELHRTDGPAIEYADGGKYWYLNDVELTEIEFLAKTKKAPCEGKEIEIDGVKYKLVKA